MDSRAASRKLEHIEIVLRENVDYDGWCSAVYDSIKLIHQALPGIDYESVDLSVEFLKYKLGAPLLITGITGGHPATTKINEMLARLALKYGVAIGVGSQRPMLKNFSEEVVESYRVVRRLAEGLPVVGNIGYNTLSELSAREVEALVKAIEADALAVHLNPGQELVQPEGNAKFNYDGLAIVEELLDCLDVPIIFKEVGTGLSMESVSRLYSVGVEYFDVAGSCGTNWIVVEKYRNRAKERVAEHLRDWGIPTPLSVIETRAAAPDSYVIASGGVWDGVKAVKNLVIGADLVGLAKPILKRLLEGGANSAEAYLEEYIETMKSVMFLIGAERVNELAKKPVVLLDPITTYLDQRGVDLKRYINFVRSTKCSN